MLSPFDRTAQLHAMSLLQVIANPEAQKSWPAPHVPPSVA
jgi:hypothetical protein